MNSRTIMAGMLVLLMIAGAAVIFLGTRDPAPLPPAPVVNKSAEPDEKKIPAVSPPPAAPTAGKRPVLPRQTPRMLKEVPAVEGMVSDRTGALIAGASVRVGTAESPEITRTGPDGRFTLAEVPEAGCKLTITHPDYLPRTVAFTPGPKKPAQLAITLSVGGEITGTVLRGGRPEPHARLFLEGVERAQTDAEGRYAIRGLVSGSFVLHLELADSPYEGSPPPASWLSRKVEVVEDEPSTADFHIPACDGIVEGFVLFEGRPLAQAGITLQVACNLGHYNVRVETVTDGSYHIAGLPDGPVTVQASVQLANGVARYKSAQFELHEHETVRQDFDFPMAGRVQGEVRGLRDGEQASVLALRGAPQSLGAMTAEQMLKLHEYVVANEEVASDGSFAFEAIDPGDYVFMVTAGQPGSAEFRSGFQPANVVAGDDVSVRIILR